MGIIRARRKSETRVLLLEAGLRVLAERGVELGSLDDVADAAGFTKGAIYRQFPSKGAFLLALFEQYAAVARAGSRPRGPAAGWAETPRAHVVPPGRRSRSASSECVRTPVPTSTHRFVASETGTTSPPARSRRWRTCRGS